MFQHNHIVQTGSGRLYPDSLHVTLRVTIPTGAAERSGRRFRWSQAVYADERGVGGIRRWEAAWPLQSILGQQHRSTRIESLQLRGIPPATDRPHARLRFHGQMISVPSASSLASPSAAQPSPSGRLLWIALSSITQSISPSRAMSWLSTATAIRNTRAGVS